MKARPYQEACVDAVFRAFQQHDGTLVDMATGLGKTVVFSHISDRWKEGRVMILAHRDELIRQAADKIERITGEPAGIEMGGERVEDGLMGRCKVVVSSVQTLCRPKRQRRFQPKDFGLVIVDEAHHAVAASYRRTLDYLKRGSPDLNIDGNPNQKLLGVTATPKRADELALGQVFHSVAYSYGIEPAIADGWLVPVDQEVVKVEGLDFSKVKTVAGDLSQEELEKIVMEEKTLHKVAASTVEVAGQRPTLVFCVTVNHARMMAEVLNRYRPKSAVALSGDTDMDERRQWVERYRNGEIQYLVNCALFLEGFDAPSTAVVVMARPTKSPVLYCQVLGRGTRPLPGVVDGLETPAERRAAIADSAKPSMLALDFVGNAGSHKIVQAADILGGKYGEPVKSYAKKTMSEENRPTPIQEALERAEAELALEQEEAERRRHVKASEVTFRLQTVSPFGRGQAAPQPRTAPRGDPPTDGQIRYLLYLGVSEAMARSYTKRQASAVIDDLKSKQGR